ncbi:MAG: hypothetical protein ACT4P4_10270 [Betaproteobacteria bacterium]
MDDLGVEESLACAQVMRPVMASTPDAHEGMRAFQEKRKPVWPAARRTSWSRPGGGSMPTTTRAWP